MGFARRRASTLQNVLTRRSEGYHKQLIEFARPMAAADHGACEDHSRRRARERSRGWRSGFLPIGIAAPACSIIFCIPTRRLDDFYRCQYGEQGDFIKHRIPRRCRSEDTLSSGSPCRTGAVWTGDQKNMISVEKDDFLAGTKGWQVDLPNSKMCMAPPASSGSDVKWRSRFPRRTSRSLLSIFSRRNGCVAIKGLIS